MFRPIEVKALSGYKIWIRFADGEEGEVDLSHLAGRGVFSLWQDPSAFQAVHLGPHGEIAWNEDVELCPDSIYLKLTGKTPEEAFPVRVYRNGRPVADIVPVKAAMPAWKKPPLVRLSLGSLSLGDEVVADRDAGREGLEVVDLSR